MPLPRFTTKGNNYIVIQSLAERVMLTCWTILQNFINVAHPTCHRRPTCCHCMPARQVPVEAVFFGGGVRGGDRVGSARLAGPIGGVAVLTVASRGHRFLGPWRAPVRSTVLGLPTICHGDRGRGGRVLSLLQREEQREMCQSPQWIWKNKNEK